MEAQRCRLSAGAILPANLASASGCRIPLTKLARSPWQTGGTNRWTAACEMMPLPLSDHARNPDWSDFAYLT